MEEEEPRRQAHLAEWIVATLSTIVVLAMIGMMLYDGVRTSDPKPNLAVTAGPVEQTSTAYRVEFRARNDGDLTAAEVTVEGQLIENGQSVETSSTTLPYVPSHSTRQGGLLFRNNPDQYRLRLYPKSYQHP